eukprot:s1668_g5.t1
MLVSVLVTVAQLTLERQYLDIVEPVVGPASIPCVIHQMWNGTYDEMTEPMAGYVKSWKDKNHGSYGGCFTGQTAGPEGDLT